MIEVAVWVRAGIGADHQEHRSGRSRDHIGELIGLDSVPGVEQEPPPGFNTRRISANPAGRSGKAMTPNWQIIHVQAGSQLPCHDPRLARHIQHRTSTDPNETSHQIGSVRLEDQWNQEALVELRHTPTELNIGIIDHRCSVRMPANLATLDAHADANSTKDTDRLRALPPGHRR